MTESTGVTALSEATFGDEVERSKGPYLVDFWAEWCAPCLALKPVLEELSNELAETLRVGQVDIVAHPSLAEQFEIKSLPTLVVFVDGVPVKKMFGAKGKRQLLVEVEKFLPSH
jgi:thioredoxin 1